MQGAICIGGEIYRGRTAGDKTSGAKCTGGEKPKGRSDSGANCRGRNAGGETSVNHPAVRFTHGNDWSLDKVNARFHRTCNLKYRDTYRQNHRCQIG